MLAKRLHAGAGKSQAMMSAIADGFYKLKYR